MLGRRLFFNRAFSLATVGIAASATPAIAKISPVEEVLRDMHEIKHTLDLWDLKNPDGKILKTSHYGKYQYLVYPDEISRRVTEMTEDLFLKSMDFFPEDPTKEDVKKIFTIGKQEYSELESKGLVHPSHIRYYNDNDPAVLPVAVARHVLGIWKMPVCAPYAKCWSQFVKRYAKTLPTE